MSRSTALRRPPESATASAMRRLRGSNAKAVIASLNPVIRGWAAYHRGMVSSEVFNSLGAYMWKLTWKWARHSHPNKPASWVKARYFGSFNPFRQDAWVFGDRETGSYLRKHCWTRIRRHVMVKGGASPDDPDLAGYWRYRRDKHGTPLDTGAMNLLSRQRGRCPLCGDRLLTPGHLPDSPEEWQNWWLDVTQRPIERAPSAPGQQPGTREATPSLIHASCWRAPGSAGARQCNPQRPRGLLEPCAARSGTHGCMSNTRLC